jgi:hypothetical protein
MPAAERPCVAALLGVLAGELVLIFIAVEFLP